MRTDTPRPILLKNYEPSPFLIDTVDLDVALDPTATRVVAKMKVRPNPEGRSTTTLVLDGEHLMLEQVKLSGKVLEDRSFTVTDQSLTIRGVPDRPFTLEITTVCDPEANKSLSGLYRSQGVFCTQCEAEGFRRITYFLDRPDVLAVYTTRIEADKAIAPVLLSNGNLIESGAVKTDSKTKSPRHFAVWHDPFPKPCYLFALVGGDLACVKGSYKTGSGRRIALRIYVEHGKEDRCSWAMDSLKRSMRWDERRFGLEYDLDMFMIVAVSDFNMGAMENKGLNIFNDKLVLATPETATDQSFTAIESVIAHEYFHNWTGNRITCRDWFQLCLKEGLTVFRDQEFSSDERSRPVQRIMDVRDLRMHQFPEDNGPLAHPVRPERYIEINNFYTATVYEKGAELCRMIHTMLGEEGFSKGMDLYFDRHDGDATTVEHFIKCFEDACHADLSQFMLWYQQAGTPELICSLKHDAKKKTVDLSVEQVLPASPQQKRKKPHVIPLRLGLIDPDGKDLPLELRGKDHAFDLPDDVILLTKRRETFTFENIDKRPVPSLLRGFSAPVNLTLSLSDEDLRHAMAFDSDPFNRWQAGQTYATRVILDLVKSSQAGKRAQRGKRLAESIRSILLDRSLDPAFRALCLALPSEGDLARVLVKNIDPELIHRARKRVLGLVGRRLSDDLKTIYSEMQTDVPYLPTAEQAGQRALRNGALLLLAKRGTAEDAKLAAKHYRQAKNMTDKISALYQLTDMRGPERDRAFANFYRTWSKDHVVIDQWFVIQALSSRADTLKQVKALTQHKLFSLKNPNKVRALIGAFAAFNPTGFHRLDGAGYNFVADTILEIDDFNPQVSARLTGAFKNWKTLEDRRQKAAKLALKRIARHDGLSRDVQEIVQKMLEA